MTPSDDGVPKGHPTAAPWFFPATMGAFGVAMGFAAFVLFEEQRNSPPTFLLGLLAAAVTSFAIEAVRERAEGHVPGAKTQPGRVLGLLVLLAIFEVYVSGTEEMVRIVADGGATQFLGSLFASGITSSLALQWQLLLFAGLWVVLGAAAAWSTLHPHDTTDRPPLESARRVGRGLLVVAGIGLAYFILARLAITLWVLITRPQEYAPTFSALMPEPGNTSGNPLAWLPVYLAAALEWLPRQGRWGGVALLGAVVLVVITLHRTTRTPATNMGPRLVAFTMAGTLVLLLLGPFVTSATQGARLLQVVGAVAFTWLSPLVVLAVAMPRLRGPARSPRLWGLVAFAVAVLLVGITWNRLSSPGVSQYVAVLVAALVVTGWVFLKGADVLQFWPLVALTLGIAAFEGSSLLQRLTFLTTFKQAALIQSAPLDTRAEVEAGRGFKAVATWGRAGVVDRPVAEWLQRIDTLPDDVLPVVRDQLQRESAAALDSAYLGALAPLCQSSGSALLDTYHADINMACARARSLLARVAEPEAALATDSLRGTARDSAVAQLEALVRLEWVLVDSLSEPWGSGFTTLLTGADDEVIRRAFDFRWRDPSSDESRAISARALEVLPAELQELEPAAQLQRAMRDTLLAPTPRLWMVLDAFARSTPPGEAAEGWMRDSERRQLPLAREGGGPPLSMALGWWYQRAKHLAALVRARFLAGAPVDEFAPSVSRIASTPDRFAREDRTIVALRFAREQLIQRRVERAGEGAVAVSGRAALVLELSLGASFAFWATAGLLAGLSAREKRQTQGP